MSEDSDDELTKRKVEKRVREEHETEMWKKMYYEATDGTKTSQLHEARMWKRKFYEVTIKLSDIIPYEQRMCKEHR